MGSLALQLSKTVRVYTNGNEEAESKIQAITGRPEIQSRITLEERPIRSVYMVSSEASDVLVTLTDGTQFEESFIVSELVCDWFFHCSFTPLLITLLNNQGASTTDRAQWAQY